MSRLYSHFCLHWPHPDASGHSLPAAAQLVPPSEPLTDYCCCRRCPSMVTLLSGCPQGLLQHLLGWPCCRFVKALGNPKREAPDSTPQHGWGPPGPGAKRAWGTWADPSLVLAPCSPLGGSSPAPILQRAPKASREAALTHPAGTGGSVCCPQRDSGPILVPSTPSQVGGTDQDPQESRACLEQHLQPAQLCGSGTKN